MSDSVATFFCHLSKCLSKLQQQKLIVGWWSTKGCFVFFFPFLYNPHFLSPACPHNPLACVGDITWLLAPSSCPPATVINSVNKWIMTGRLAGSHHWPWVLLEWPFFGLTKKPFWYLCWKYTRNDGLSASGGKQSITHGEVVVVVIPSELSALDKPILCLVNT